MHKYSLITTYYGLHSICPSKKEIRDKFRYDGSDEDLYINFDNSFDPWNKDHLIAGVSGRKDLIYGKIFLLRDFIKNNILNKYEFLCHIDYSDTKFARSYRKMMNEFELSGHDFCIATEKTCWPYLETINKWTSRNINLPEFHYLNSGCIISKPNILLKYLEQLENICLNSDIDFWDDQGVWQYYHFNIETLNLDKNCKYFFCTGMLDNSYYTLDNNQIKTKFNTYPYIIHDNSSFSLNLINII